MARPRLRKGDSMDGFAVGDLVHAGGMALLWEAAHPDRPGEPMLMKVPRLFEGEDPAAIVSFEMEQMILPRLSGPHVPRFVAAAGFEAQPYLVMERVPGSSLLPRLPELPLPPGEVAAIGARVAAALDALHRQHVVHLDVKPSNILHRPTGEAVLVDFGLSRHAQLPDLMEEEFRLPYGTAPYMAPEQVMGVRTEPRSDLFALGAMLYFFATGTRPFGDPQRLSGLKRRLWRDPAPPRRLRPDCPPWLQELILRCLEVDPERRHPTAAQLAFDLRHPDAAPLTPPRRQAAPRRLRGGVAPPLQPGRPAALRPPPRPRGAGGRGAHRRGRGGPVRAAAGAGGGAARRGRPRPPHLAGRARRLPQRAADQPRDDRQHALNAAGRNKHAQRLAELRHWAEPMRLPEGRVTFHVLEAVSPAAALLDYATANPVDHIVLGARCRSVRRKLLGSVSGEVAAQAPCTVTVVRLRPGLAEEGATA